MTDVTSEPMRAADTAQTTGGGPVDARSQQSAAPGSWDAFWACNVFELADLLRAATAALKKTPSNAAAAEAIGCTEDQLPVFLVVCSNKGLEERVAEFDQVAELAEKKRATDRAAAIIAELTADWRVAMIVSNEFKKWATWIA